MSAVAVASDDPARCRHCHHPVRLVHAPDGWAWVHTDPPGSFSCRDDLTGMALASYATPPSAEPAPARPTGNPPVPPHHRWP